MSRDEIANALKPDRAIILNRICDQLSRTGEMVSGLVLKKC